MEAVGVAASFAGLLGFAGQAINGIVQLRAFFKDVKLAPRRTEDLLKDMDILTDTLEEIRQLVTVLDGTSEDELRSGAKVNTSILKSHLMSCAEDISKWVKVAKEADPRSEKGLRAFFRRVKIAADKGGFEELGNRLSSHQQRIGISLQVLGRSLDHAGNEKLDQLFNKFDGLTEAHLKLSDRINTSIAASDKLVPISDTISEVLGKELQPLENWMKESVEDHLEMMSAYHSESQQSMHSVSHSLSSLASHISELLERTQLDERTSKDSPIKSIRQFEWCSDALSGIDDAFEEKNDGEEICVFCNVKYDSQSSIDSCDKGWHLAEQHAFGCCNLDLSYNSWEELEEHLVEFHKLKLADEQIISRFRRRRRPHQFYRGDYRSDGQPLQNPERSTEHLVLIARLHTLLSRDVYLGTSTFGVEFLEGLDNEVFERNRHLMTPPEVSYEISCIEEEMIVSGNYHLIIPRSYPEDLWMSRAARRTDLGARSTNQRRRINDWLFQVFMESNTLKSMLRSGRVVPGLAKPESPNWVIPVVESWDVDEAATGHFEYEVSDGAVDSRDDLKADVDPLVHQSQEDIEAHRPKTEKVRPHVCSTCKRSYARLEHLKRHERSHTREKPPERPECAIAFARHDPLPQPGHEDIKDLDPTPRAQHEPWRFTPSLLDPDSFAFVTFAKKSRQETGLPGL